MGALLVGRFQPFHLGHAAAVGLALGRPGPLWLCIGSSNAPRDMRNPFSAAERREMIESSLPREALGRVSVYAVPDFDDHARWIDEIDATVPAYSTAYTSDAPTAAMFRARGVEAVALPMASRETLEGSRIRAMIAAGEDGSGLVPAGTAAVLRRVGARARLARLCGRRA